ncbi:MAG: rhodanese-like domain-containing protein [Anaerolineales bacterium]
MAKRTSKKRRKQNNNLVWIILGAVVVIGVIAAGVLTNSPNADQATALPLEISAQDAYQYYQDGTLILDVRTQEEWDAGHVPDATLIPLDQLQGRISELPEDQDIVVICRSGNRSATARDMLLSSGFDSVTSVAGGFNQWTANGYPVSMEP